MIKEAVESRNTDVTHIKKDTHYRQIPGQITYYVDLSKPWTVVDFIDEPFTDKGTTATDETLYIFTDGSVKGTTGGYGYHTIRNIHYQKHIGQKPEEYSEEQSRYEEQQNIYGTKAEKRNPICYNKALWLSSRCSIDFCEAYAIRDSLVRITYELPEINDLKSRGSKVYKASLL